jgi:hypothetical protein
MGDALPLIVYLHPEMKIDRSGWIFILLVVVLGTAHLPFIPADPDHDISYSRGPFTDEGLNTIQLRNFLDHGYLDINECDNLLKTPLFNALLTLPMAIFGTNLMVARLTVLMILLLTLLIWVKSKRLLPVVIIFAATGLTHYHIFQFSHFSLSEMVAVALVILSIYFYYYARLIFANDKKRTRYTIAATLLVSSTFLLKIQFIYLLLLLPLAQLLEAILFRSSSKRMGFLVIYSAGISIAVLVLFIVAWYLPFRADFEHMMAHQSGVFSISAKSFEYLRFNLTHLFFKGPATILSVAYLASLVLLLFRIRKGHSPPFKLLLPVALAWNLLEFHKLIMVYLPARYQVSLLASLALTIAIIIAEYWVQGKERRIFWKVRVRGIAAIFVMVVLIFNIRDYVGLYNNRTYTIEEVNDYIDMNYRAGGPVVGAWAPSLTWKASARSFPVWNMFLNYEDPVDTFRPEIIISEPDEEDSNQAYISQGIDLDTVSDSVRCFEIGQWTVCLHWIEQD